MKPVGAANRLIMMGSISGFATIAIGAFGAHALEGVLNAHQMRNVYETGVQYQMMHTLAVFVCALIIDRYPHAKYTLYAAYLFLWGVILFSGSLYLLAISNLKILGIITPIGGVCFLAGWVLLFRDSIQTKFS